MEIQKQELKQILTDQRKDYERYIGALKEDFDSKVDLIVEQYFDIKKTLNSHTETLNSHTKTLNSHTETLNSHTKILNSHTETLSSHTEMIASIKEDIEIMKIDIAFIKGGLKQKVDAEEFGVLERRVALLEAKAR